MESDTAALIKLKTNQGKKNLIIIEISTIVVLFFLIISIVAAAIFGKLQEAVDGIFIITLVTLGTAGLIPLITIFATPEHYLDIQSNGFVFYSSKKVNYDRGIRHLRQSNFPLTFGVERALTKLEQRGDLDLIFSKTAETKLFVPLESVQEVRIQSSIFEKLVGCTSVFVKSSQWISLDVVDQTKIASLQETLNKLGIPFQTKLRLFWEMPDLS